MAVFFLLFLAVIAGVFADVSQNYCKVSSCINKNKIHTMCEYNNNSTAKTCGKVKKIGFNDTEKNNIVKIHNEMRQFVASGKETRGRSGPQPAAVNMPNLTWDKELETIAQRWANQCSYGHDQCRDVDRYAVGQNIAIISTSGEYISDWKNMVQNWYDEVCLFNNSGVNSYEFESKTGHYTQIVWANTTKIGCGGIEYQYRDRAWNNTYLVCNYGPSGNWIGKKIYQVKN